MSGEFEKYAVYWVPKRTDALARFGASWTGWCAEQGEFRNLCNFRDVSVDVRTITRQLKPHGFHAAIQAPFRLDAGRSRFSIEHALEEVIDDSVAFRMPRLRLAVVDGRVAIVPGQACSALVALVTRIGAAMAPLGAARVAVAAGGSVVSSGLAEAPIPSLVQDKIAISGAESLVQLPAADAHRFHLPLTDPLPLDAAFRVLEELKPLLKPMLDTPRELRDVALMGDPGGGRPLRVLQRYDLREHASQYGAANAMPCHGPHVLAPQFGDPRANSDIAV